MAVLELPWYNPARIRFICPEWVPTEKEAAERKAEEAMVDNWRGASIPTVG